MFGEYFTIFFIIFSYLYIKNMIKNILILCFQIVLLSQIFAQKPLTAFDVQSFRRLSQVTPTPDGKFILYSINKWNNDTGRSSSHFEYIELATNTTGILTNPNMNRSDFNPAFASTFGNTLFFLSTRSGSPQIWTVEMPSTPSQTPPDAKQFTNYPVPISNFKISKNGAAIAFSVDVYSQCGDDLTCTANKDKDVEKRGTNTWAIYDKLLMNHWDHWLTEKVSHVFVQKIASQIKFLGKLDAPTPSGNPLDMMVGLETNSPVGPFGGAEMYDISPDGTEVAFTGADRARDEAWNTSWKIYVSKVGTVSSKPTWLSTKNTARTTQPLYNSDGSKIAYLAMDRPGLESDKLHIELWTRSSNTTDNITGKIDKSINDYIFHDETTFFAICTEVGVNRLNKFTITPSKKFRNFDVEGEAIFERITDGADDFYSNSIPKKIPNTSNYALQRSAYNDPADIWIMDGNQAFTTKITKTNDVSGYELTTPESFIFKGAKNEDVQGWLLRPIKFNPANKYPLAYLVHGGPESAWTSGFGYGWNPQLWTNHGFVTVMINFHGSTGMGQKFTDSIINDWGGAPYEDLMIGLDYILQKYTFIDGNKACAAGGSFGGYMINWIQGHSKRFKCLVCHDGVFSAINMAYATDEIWFPFAENCPLGEQGCRPYDPKYRDNFFKFSPEMHVANWTTPELVIQGETDYRIPMSEAVSIFTALQIQNVPSRFVYYDKENHWVLKPQNQIKWYDEVLGWMDKYLK